MSREQILRLIDLVSYYWFKYLPSFAFNSQVWLDGLYGKLESEG